MTDMPAVAPNPYEAACQRYDRALANYPRVKEQAERMIRDADLEFENARAELRRYEERPGIPKPEYRVLAPAVLTPGTETCPGGY